MNLMAPHSSTLAWKIPWTEEPGRLQSIGSWSRTRLSNFTFTFHFSLSCIGEGNGNPLQCSCLENPRDGGGWWAAVYGVTQSRTRLRQLSSSSSSMCVRISGDGVVLNHDCNLGLPLNCWTLSNSLQCSVASASSFYRIMAWVKL